MNDLVNRDPRINTEYQVSMFAMGNVVTISLQVELTALSVMESFDMPLRVASQRYVEKLTDFGVKLLTQMSKVGGVTRVQMQLFEVQLTCGGLFEVETITMDVERGLKELFVLEGFDATGEISIKQHTVEKNEKWVHPFGPLPLRLQAVRLRGKHIPGK